MQEGGLGMFCSMSRYRGRGGGGKFGMLAKSVRSMLLPKISDVALSCDIII